jgi:hypothetical protein
MTVHFIDIKKAKKDYDLVKAIELKSDYLDHALSIWVDLPNTYPLMTQTDIFIAVRKLEEDSCFTPYGAADMLIEKFNEKRVCIVPPSTSVNRRPLL